MKDKIHARVLKSRVHKSQERGPNVKVASWFIPVASLQLPMPSVNAFVITVSY